MSAIVGALACQKNSFLRSFKTSVVASKEYVPVEASQNRNKKKSDIKDLTQSKMYAVELKDTILFPEGGGQPFDKGSIVLPDDKIIEVKSVLRDRLTALHITEELLEPGTEVTLNVDWDRRVDLMQQHTGQHLLSAVFDTYNLETLSWAMGDSINYIELPEKVSDEVLEQVSSRVNELIFEAHPISVVTPDQHGGELDTSHIPDDYDVSKGIIRIVKIGDLDANPCCGTHLTSTSQIQAISLFHQQSIRGGHSKLFFTCGARVHKYAAKLHSILKNVSGTHLSCQIDEVVEKVGALSVSYRKSTSRESNLLREIAAIEARKVYTTWGTREVEYVYRGDNNPEYLTLVQKELTTLINSAESPLINFDTKTVVLLNGDYPSGAGGMVKILGPKSSEIQAELKQRIQELKGGGKGNSFQGKIVRYGKGELEAVTYYLDSLGEQ